MNCHTHHSRTRNDGRSVRMGRMEHSARHRRGGAVIRFKEALYDLVDMTARERFESRKPRF